MTVPAESPEKLEGSVLKIAAIGTEHLKTMGCNAPTNNEKFFPQASLLDETLKVNNGCSEARVLVTGPDGFVGTCLCRELLERGWSVVGAKRNARPEFSAQTDHMSLKGKEHPSVRFVCVGDIGPATDWTTALEGIDAVVHLAARVHVMKDSASDSLAEYRKVNVEGTRRLAEAAAMAGVKRFVFISSIKVNGESTDDMTGAFKESDAPNPEDPYSVSKWEAEGALQKIERQTGMAVVIIRPPLVYGPGVSANFLKLIKLVDSGLPLPLGGINNKRSLVGLTNLVDLICFCLDHLGAAGEIWLPSDNDDVSTPELVRRIASALGKSPRLIPVPQWAMLLLSRLTGKTKQVKRLFGSLQIDSTKVRHVLGWTPPCSMEEELKKTANWLRTGHIQCDSNGCFKTKGGS